MPAAGNGIGTVHYGRSAEAEDGSYVTTVWIVFLFVPIFPLRSERILPLSEFNDGGGHVRTRYAILGRVARDWREIRKSYLVGWSIVAWIVSLIWLYPYVSHVFGKRNEPWVILTWFVVPFLPLIAWQLWFKPRPKLRPIEVMPGSEFSVYRKDEGERNTTRALANDQPSGPRLDC